VLPNLKKNHGEEAEEDEDYNPESSYEETSSEAAETEGEECETSEPENSHDDEPVIVKKGIKRQVPKKDSQSLKKLNAAQPAKTNPVKKRKLVESSTSAPSRKPLIKKKVPTQDGRTEAKDVAVEISEPTETTNQVKNDGKKKPTLFCEKILT